MPTMEETKGLFAIMRPELTAAREELSQGVSDLQRMLNVLEALDPQNGNVLAAGTEAQLAADLALARKNLRKVQGFTYSVNVPVEDENGDPVLDEEGEATYTTEERYEPGFLERSAALRAKLLAVEERTVQTPDGPMTLAQGIALAATAAGAGE